MSLNLIGNWLWYGGRLRLLEPLTTNGGQTIAVGEIVRLARLEPYTGASTLASLHFVSEDDSSKSLCVTGWDERYEDRFELLL